MLEFGELQAAKTLFREDLGKARAKLDRINTVILTMDGQENPNRWAKDTITRQRQATVANVAELEREIDTLAIEIHALVMELARRAAE